MAVSTDNAPVSWTCAAPLHFLWGRQREQAELNQMLLAVRSGRSRVLVVRGEAGIGKTALLEYLAGLMGERRVVRASGVESEMELAYAGLHQFCGSMLAALQRLPGPQREALEVAFGLRGGEAPDRLMVGLAVLGLVSQAADNEPLVCLVDDVQWLDQVSAQTLAFVGRRLLAERVALVFAVRDGDDGGILAGLPELIVRGLPEADARALLDAAIPGLLDERVRERIVAETGGNPLALLELPRGLTPAAAGGGFGLPDAVPLASGIEQSFLQRLEGLAADTRRLLLVAAADPVGDVTLLWMPRHGWGSVWTRPMRLKQRDWWRSDLGSGFGIRWCARRFIARRLRRNAARFMVRWPTPPTRCWILIVALGIGRTRPRDRMRQSLPSSRDRLPVHGRVAARRPRRRFSSARRR